LNSTVDSLNFALGKSVTGNSQGFPPWWLAKVTDGETYSLDSRYFNSRWNFPLDRWAVNLTNYHIVKEVYVHNLCCRASCLPCGNV